MELTGATSNQLQYLERSGLISPERVWNGKRRPEVYYDWQKLLEIRAIRSLREKTSLQTIRKILDFFEAYAIDATLRDKQIVAVDGEVFWVKTDWSDFGEQMHVLKIADKKGKGIGQYLMLVVPSFNDVVAEVWEAARASKVVDLASFKGRALAQPA
jgi:hypothetical protein